MSTFVARLVLQGVIENEEFIVAPVIDVLADLDVNLIAINVIDVVKDA